MNNSYIIKTTTGGEREYSHEDMIEICRQYLKKNGNENPTKSECVAEINDFVKRFKFVDNNSVEKE